MLRLVVVAGPDRGRAFEIPAEVAVVNVGRAPGNTVRLTDEEVSRRHVSARREGNSWFVVDEGSTNGTKLNGLPVRKQELRHGDEIAIGDTRLGVELPDGGARTVSTTVSGEERAPEIKARVAVGEATSDGLSTDLEAARKGLRLLRDIGAAASRATSVADLGRALVETLLHVEPADRAVFLLPEGEGFRVAAAAAKRGVIADRPVSRTLLELAKKEGAALLCADAQQDPRVMESASVQDLGIRSAVCVPLLASGRLLGLLHLESQGGAARCGCFGEEHLRLLATAGDALALALENLRMREALLARERVEQELQLAREIQGAFLPEELPRVAGLTAAARAVPAREVGGDFYGLWPAGDGSAVAVLGDVAGKGVPAALLMARALAEARAAAAAGLSPGAALSAVNRALASEIPMGLFVTAVVARIERAAGRLVYANAGHPLPLVRRGDGSVEALEGARSLPLGLDPETSYGEAESAFAEGDLLLLLTDGIGGEGDVDPALALASAPPDPRAVLEAVLREPGAEPYRDDRTALAILAGGGRSPGPATTRRA